MGQPLTITLPEAISESDRERVLESLRKATRNAEIRARFPEYKARLGATRAWYALADEYGLSDEMVRTIIYRDY